MEISITAEWILKYMTVAEPTDDENEIALVIHTNEYLIWVDLVLSQLGIPKELVKWNENDEYKAAFTIKLFDLLKVRDEIPIFIKILENSGDYEKQFRDFEVAMKLKNIKSNINTEKA